MRGLGIARIAVGLCIALAASSAWADSSSFVARWHWNQAESVVPPGEPPPNDVTVEISRVDATHVKWSLTILAPQGQKSVETFDAMPNGEFYPVSSDTTAAFRFDEGTLQGTFKGPNGETDTLTCTVSANRKKMTCKGVLIDGQGKTANYVDVFDRM